MSAELRALAARLEAGRKPKSNPHGSGPAAVWIMDLGSPEMVEDLAGLQLTPRRTIGGPWALVPFGTDVRTIETVIAAESETAFERLDGAIAKYVEVIETELVEAISSLLEHPFAKHLRG